MIIISGTKIVFVYGDILKHDKWEAEKKYIMIFILSQSVN